MPFVLFLLGAAAVGLVAASASAKGKQGGDGRGEGRTYTLDSSLPAQLRQQVLAALATEKDPTRLVTFAAQCADAGYPLSAAALTQRAVELGGALSLPAPPQAAPSARAQPQPGPTSPGTPVPGPAQPAAPTSALDASMPPAMQVAVLGALTTEQDAGKLQAFAQEIQLQYPIAAGLLMAKAYAMRPVQQPQPAAAPVPAPASPAPAQPPPTPQQAAPANPFTLDATLPPAMQSAVLGALTTEQDANKLQAFAQEIQAQYPIAAGLLMAKANAMRIPQQPAPQPTPAVNVAPAPAPAATPQATPAGLPIGDASTRTGRNAARPTGYPFIHLRGESTYPAKIAKQATGSEGNYSQLTHINPQFAKDGVHWINIQTGDALNIPWEWVAKLTGLYHIEVDPGVSPPASAAAPTTALAVRKGGTNGLTTHA